jgi:adenylate cyclase
VGYSRLIGTDEPGTLAKLACVRSSVIDPLMATHGGRIFKTTGDGLLAEFGSGVQALQCAIAIQQAMREHQGLELRIGLHSADVRVQPDGDLLGDGVNVAARLEGLAEPGGICISGRVREDAAGKLTLEVDDLGEPELKNITQQHRVFRVRLDAPERPALPLPDKPSIAVLPFANMSGDLEQEYFADGVTEDIITALSRFRTLFVIARNSTFVYKGKSPDIRQVGRELGVRYVLEGSLRKAGNRVRITAQLIEAASGSHIWANKYDGVLGDLFGLQDHITESVAGIIEPTINRAEVERLRRRAPRTPDAYDHYLRALAETDSFTAESIQAMHDHALHAIKLDPMFAPAYAIAARSYLQRLLRYGPSDQDSAEALDLIERGLRADRLDANMLGTAAHCITYFADDIAAGLTHADEALLVNPNIAHVLMQSGMVRIRAGRMREAIEHFERALRLSPLDNRGYAIFGDLGVAYFINGDQALGLQWAQKSVQRNPNYDPGWVYVASMAGLMNKLEVGRRAVDRIRALVPKASVQGIERAYRVVFPEGYVEYLEGLRRAGLPE